MENYQDLGAYIFFGVVIFTGFLFYMRLKRERDLLELSILDAEIHIHTLENQNMNLIAELFPEDEDFLDADELILRDIEESISEEWDT